MTIIVNAETQPAQIRIEDELTIYTAADSKQQLMDVLAAHPAFVVELSAVSEIDTSGVQLLLMVQREAQRLGKTLTLSGASPAVQEVIGLLNLSELSAAQTASEETAV